MSIQPVFVVQQPQQAVYNSFGLFNGENLLENWSHEAGCCGCGGTHFTTLTNDRLLSRYEEYRCFTCCCEPPRRDSSMFLFDIGQLVDTMEAKGCLAVLCPTLCSCCCERVKVLQARGTFGSENDFIYLREMPARPKPSIARSRSHSQASLSSMNFLFHPGNKSPLDLSDWFGKACRSTHIDRRRTERCLHH